MKSSILSFRLNGAVNAGEHSDDENSISHQEDEIWNLEPHKIQTGNPILLLTIIH